MRIGFFQFNPRFGDRAYNIDYIVSEIRKQQNGFADILVLPELATTGYLFLSKEEVREMAEPIPGPTSRTLEVVCKEKNMRMVIGLAESAQGGALYNSAALIGPDGVEGVYRKMHLFHEEKLFFKPGDLGFPLFDVMGAKIAMLVCFDHMFPEAARTVALAGAQIVCHAANLVLPEYAQLTTRVRAIENRMYWVLANRYGSESRGNTTHTYTGASQIVAHNGKLIAAAPKDEDSLMIADIDPSLSLEKKVTPLSDLFKDRRTEAYQL